REGWDVQNVTVVVGLRPYTAKANILPEQTIGRATACRIPTLRCGRTWPHQSHQAGPRLAELVCRHGAELFPRRPLLAAACLMIRPRVHGGAGLAPAARWRRSGRSFDPSSRRSQKIWSSATLGSDDTVELVRSLIEFRLSDDQLPVTWGAS